MVGLIEVRCERTDNPEMLQRTRQKASSNSTLFDLIRRESIVRDTVNPILDGFAYVESRH